MSLELGLLILHGCTAFIPSLSSVLSPTELLSRTIHIFSPFYLLA